jgi:hypothetical protein
MSILFLQKLVPVLEALHGFFVGVWSRGEQSVTTGKAGGY